MEFKVGDYVTATFNNGPVLEGMVGQIKTTDNNTQNYGVEWPGLNEGHDCKGTCKLASGYYMLKSELRLATLSEIDTVFGNSGSLSQNIAFGNSGSLSQNLTFKTSSGTLFHLDYGYSDNHIKYSSPQTLHTLINDMHSIYSTLQVPTQIIHSQQIDQFLILN